MNRWLSALCAVALLFCLPFAPRALAAASSATASASMAAASGAEAAGPKEVDVVQNVTFSNRYLPSLSEIWNGENIAIHIHWDSKPKSQTIRPGDYFEIALPALFHTVSAEFPLKDEQGLEIAKGTLSSAGQQGGGLVRVEFLQPVAQLGQVRGTVDIASNLIVEEIKENTVMDSTFLTYQQKPLEKKVTVLVPTRPLVNEVLHKSNGRRQEDTFVRWYVRLNHMMRDFKQMVVDDILSGEGEYIPESFYLQKVTFDPFGAVKEYGEEMPFELQMADDRRSFKIEFGEALSGQAYLLTYRTTYRQGISVNNAIHLKAEGIETTYKSDFIDSSTTGTATGKPAPSEAPSAASGTAPGQEPLISLAGENPMALGILAGVLLLGVLIVALNRKRR